jgi:hypothetical protein
VKLKHVKDKKLDFKTNAHFKKSNGMAEISINFKKKITMRNSYNSFIFVGSNDREFHILQ